MAAQATVSSAGGTLGVFESFNHDLNVSDGYLAAFPLVSPLLKNSTLNEEFFRRDRYALSLHRRFRRWGLLAVLGAGVGLSGAAAGLTAQALGGKVPWLVEVLSECAGLGAIAAVVVLWWTGTHRNWLAARFEAERIRQWHFQQFLDKDLTVLLLKPDRQEFTAAREERWAVFMETLRHGESGMHGYVKSPAGNELAPPRPDGCPPPAVFGELLRAYLNLRMNVQVNYFLSHTENDKYDGRMSTHGLYLCLEKTAATLLFLAVAGSAVQLLLLLAARAWGAEWHWVHGVGTVLPGIGLLLAVVSASVRAYTAGRTLGEDVERYETAWHEAKAIKDLLNDASTSDEQKLEAMWEMERLCMEELRGFVRAKRRASFLV